MLYEFAVIRYTLSEKMVELYAAELERLRDAAHGEGEKR